MKNARGFVLLLVACAGRVAGSTTCAPYSNGPKPSYHLTKECAESKMRTVASSNATEFGSCVKLAAAKNAFAFVHANRTEGLRRQPITAPLMGINRPGMTSGGDEAPPYARISPLGNFYRINVRSPRTGRFTRVFRKQILRFRELRARGRTVLRFSAVNYFHRNVAE